MTIMPGDEVILSRSLISIFHSKEPLLDIIKPL